MAYEYRLVGVIMCYFRWRKAPLIVIYPKHNYGCSKAYFHLPHHIHNTLASDKDDQVCCAIIKTRKIKKWRHINIVTHSRWTINKGHFRKLTHVMSQMLKILGFLLYLFMNLNVAPLWIYLISTDYYERYTDK